MSIVYFVEDEIDLSNLVIRYLVKEGYEVKHFATGEDAVRHITDKVDLWILDIMLPGSINGYDLIKMIRANDAHKPIIFASARDQDIDRVLGLELGGDDYISKPYSLRELMLRVKNILARTYRREKSEVVKQGPYKIDLDSRRVTEGDKVVDLTSKEYDLLMLLSKNQSQAFSREQIIEHVWGPEYFGSDRVVDDLMRRLRQKMPKLRVETLYGYGYRLL